MIYIVVFIIIIAFFANLYFLDKLVYKNDDIEILMSKKNAIILITVIYIISFFFLFRDCNYSNLLVYSILFNMLIIVGVIDFLTFYVFEYILYVYTFIGIICMILLKNFNLKDSIYGLLIGVLIYGIIYIVSKLIYKKEAFGLGDVYIIAMIGIFLGFSKTLFICFAAFYVAIFFIIFKLIFGSKIKIFDEIPFGPSIAVATMVVALYYNEIIDIYFNLVV